MPAVSAGAEKWKLNLSLPSRGGHAHKRRGDAHPQTRRHFPVQPGTKASLVTKEKMIHLAERGCFHD